MAKTTGLGVTTLSVDDSGGVVFVPALSGLGAPYWQPEARASITGSPPPGQ